MPFLPLQTLYVNFTVQVFLAIGLGYGKPRPDLMQDAPRSPDVPILSRRLLVWLVVAGLVDGRGDARDHRVGDAALRRGRRPDHGPRRVLADATSGSRSRPSDEDKSIFSSETLENPTLLKAAGVAFLATVLATELGITQHDPRHRQPDGRPVADGFVVSLAIVVIAEVKKLLKIRTTTVPALATTEPASAAA